MKRIGYKIKEEAKEIKQEIKQKIIKYVTTAFGLVAGLAWNDAIKSTIEYLFPLSKNTVLVKLIYALLMTFILVIISVYLMRVFSREKNNKKTGKIKKLDKENLSSSNISSTKHYA